MPVFFHFYQAYGCFGQLLFDHYKCRIWPTHVLVSVTSVYWPVVCWNGIVHQSVVPPWHLNPARRPLHSVESPLPMVLFLTLHLRSSFASLFHFHYRRSLFPLMTLWIFFPNICIYPGCIMFLQSYAQYSTLLIHVETMCWINGCRSVLTSIRPLSSL